MKLKLICLFLISLGVNVAQGNEKLRVVTTTTQLTDLVQIIGGDKVKVNGLMGPSVDPHLYKATARDVQYMQRADLIFYNGLHLEGRLTDVMVQLARRGKGIYAASEGVPEELLLKPTEMEGQFDPHIWFDPELWSLASGVIVEALIDKAPEYEGYFKANYTAYLKELKGLKKWAMETISELPKEKRILVTSHDAYNYFGRAFGFRVIGIQGISTVSEAGLADMARMTDFIREQKVSAIFVETSVSPATIERVSRDTGTRIGGELFSDAMGRPGEIETVGDEKFDVGTYSGMLKYNVKVIVDGLLGKTTATHE